MLVRTLIKARQNFRNPSRAVFRNRFPLAGYRRNLNAIKFVDPLTDEELRALNAFLPWNCFTADSKRTEPEAIPDRRVLLLNDRFSLSDKHVLEIGCLEGGHTIGLATYSKTVTAVDARIENVVKSIVRCAFFGYHPSVFKCNVEERPLPVEQLAADLGYHIGVLYHLRDPARHLLDLGTIIREGLLLDTHYALDHEVSRAYEVNGRSYPYREYREPGQQEVFAGMYDHAKWLKLEDIVALLRLAGFTKWISSKRTKRETECDYC